jgi:hypothetical protein
MKEQTAVEWLYEELYGVPRTLWEDELLKIFEKAKAMEQQQMKDCYAHAAFSLIDMGHGESYEEYYNSKYKK